jgi:hypothetical protein
MWSRFGGWNAGMLEWWNGGMVEWWNGGMENRLSRSDEAG